MRLSKNFSLRELTKSTAERSGIHPKDLEHLVNMTHLRFMCFNLSGMNLELLQ